MNWMDAVLIGAGLSMDACAAAVSDAMVYRGLTPVRRAAMPLCFGAFQMLMPVLGCVRCDCVDQAIDRAVEAEHGCWHSALMHSTNYLSMTKAARALNTTIFVKNAPSTAGVGFNGEGYATLTIATPTGEGLTSARSFTRARRCVLADGFRII